VSHRPKSYYRHTNAVIAGMVRELYFCRRMKQVELARFFQISQASVSRYVSGQVWT
jgi:predicted transcriptional regulator